MSGAGAGRCLTPFTAEDVGIAGIREFLENQLGAHAEHGTSSVAHAPGNSSMLKTYDPNWEGRWDAASTKLKELQGRHDFGVEYKVFESELHAAYHAQFRTALDYAEHFMPLEIALSESLNVPLPYFLSTMDLEQVRALMAKYRQDRDFARAMRDGPPVYDPIGLLAFATPAQVSAQRFVEDLRVPGRGNQRALECRMVVEATPAELHVCFIEFQYGISVTVNFERLANHVYDERFKPEDLFDRIKARIGGSHRGRFWPRAIRFYELLSCKDRFHPRQFERVELQWNKNSGFHSPEWHRLTAIPIFLDYVMGLKSADDYQTGPGAELALSANNRAVRA